MDQAGILTQLQPLLTALQPGLPVDPDDPIGKYIGYSTAAVNAFIVAVNRIFFPNGGGLVPGDISANTTVGQVAAIILQKLGGQ